MISTAGGTPQTKAIGILSMSHRAVLVHDDVGVRRDEADQSSARAHGIGAGMAGIVEAGFRIADDVHGRDIWPVVLVLVHRDRQCRPVDITAGSHDFLHRAGLDLLDATRRLPQPKGQRLQIILLGHAERPRLRAAVFHQDIAQPEARLLDDVLEQDGLIALRRQRTDIDQVHRLADARDDVGVGVEIFAQGAVELPL